MLKKLYKHEFYSLYRNVLLIYGVIVIVAIFNRIGMFFDGNSNQFLLIIRGLAAIGYGISLVGMFVLSFVVIIQRFYKHFFSGEGYLTFTLPIKSTAHLVCKLVCGTTVFITNILVAILSVFIFTLGTLDWGKAIAEFIRGFTVITSELGSSEVAFRIVIFVLFILVSLVSSILMFYAAISIGQQFKNRILGAVIAYICMYICAQIVSAICIIPTMVNYTGLNSATDTQYFDFMFNTFLFAGVVVAIIAAAYFLITNYMISKKLNLE